MFTCIFRHIWRVYQTRLYFATSDLVYHMHLNIRRVCARNETSSDVLDIGLTVLNSDTLSSYITNYDTIISL